MNIQEIQKEVEVLENLSTPQTDAELNKNIQILEMIDPAKVARLKKEVADRVYYLGADLLEKKREILKAIQ